MKEDKGDMIKGGEPLHAFWNKGGFVLCTAGYADIRINDQMYRLTRGSVFIVTPLVQIYDFTPSSDYTQISFVNDLKVFFPIFKSISDTGIPLKISQHPIWKLNDKECEFVKEQKRRIEEKTQRIKGSGSQNEQHLLSHLIDIIRQETMLEVVSNHPDTFQASADSIRNGYVAYRFIIALHENYKTERTVTYYASLANMSTGHFSAIIRETTGRSPSDWISSVTTSYAKILLEQTDKSIKEIANDLNFPEQFTFRKYFKRNAGVSPSDYRNQIQ